jgi:outer membrane beta-barrel protein
MKWPIALIAVVFGAEAFASPEITGTSSVAIPDDGEDVPGRVELRLFAKESHVIARAGFSYLSRSDFYTNPGISLDVAWYPLEVLGVELSGTGYFARLSSTADALRRTTGLLPDSQKPLARIGAGARWAFAYGKLLVELLSTVIHVDASAAAHVGVLITGDAPNFAADAGLSIQAVAWDRLLFFVEGLYFMSYERRTTTTFASGPQLTIGLGVLL